MPSRTTQATDASEYTTDDLDADLSLYEEEDPTEVAARSSIVQSGWNVVKKALKDSEMRFTEEFKFTETAQLVKFVTNEPFAFYHQHWIERPGKKSFVCLGTDCPLCAIGDNPREKTAFSVLNFSAEEPVLQMLVTSPSVTRRLAAFDDDEKTGPLDRLFYSLARKGKGQSTDYTILPVKPRDLAEDWGIDPQDIEDVIESAEPCKASLIRITPRAELMEIAAEVSRAASTDEDDDRPVARRR